jgi:predicted metal-dependent hydrolase
LIIPNGVNSSHALKFLKEHESWIAGRKIRNQEEASYLGREIQLHTRTIQGQKDYQYFYSNNILTIEGAFRANSDEFKLYEQWLYLRARGYLLKRTIDLARDYGFRINKVTVRRQTSRWGSCSSKGNISLNYKLMKHPEKVIDYVILHELCHLTEMNHSVKFWDLVSRYVPDYKELRKKLKGNF